MRKTTFVAGFIVCIWGALFLLTRGPSESGQLQTETVEGANVEAIERPRIENTESAAPAPLPNDAEEKLHVSEVQIDSYLERHRRGPENLLAAFQVSQDKKYIEEAARQFPEDSQVQLAVLLENIFPDDRRKWLDAFKKSSPGNPISDYLSALEYFKQSDPLRALQDLSATIGKDNFNSFTLEALQNREELLRASGLSQLESKNGALSLNSLTLESHLKTLTAKIIEWQKTLREGGDNNTADAVIQSGVLMSRHMSQGSGSELAVSQAVGIGTETAILKQLDPDTHYDFLGQTPGERLAELQRKRQLIREMAGNLVQLQSRLTPDETAVYIDRIKLYGELNAYKWLKEKFGDQ